MLPPPNYANPAEYLKQCTSKYGDVYMMQHFGVKYRKSEILRDIDTLSSYFQHELKLKKGDVYTVFMPTTVQSIIAFYALAQIGVIMSPVHPLYSTEYLKEIMINTESKGIMVLDLLLKDHIKTINELCVPCLVCCSSDYSKGLKHIGCKTGEAALHILKNKGLKNATMFSKAIKESRIPSLINGNGQDTAVYLNGGGTTGKSKTIMLSGKALNELVYRVSDLDNIKIPGEEAEIIVLPMFHGFGLLLGVHMAICNSARLIPMMQFDAKLFNKLMRKNMVVGIMGIPAMFKKIKREKHFDGPWLSDMRLMFCGGDDVSDNFVTDFNSYFQKHGASGRLYQGYGLTEVGSVCCTNSEENHKSGSIGIPLRGVKMEIWDDEHNKLPNGEVGEIVVTGPTMMQGYFNKNGIEGLGLYRDKNGESWVLSGDLGYQDDDGFFYFAGRKKRLIIISGYNVYPNDIERVTLELPFIRDCCAVQGYQDGKSIVRLYASLKEEGDKEEYINKIRKVCADNFSAFYIPKEIIFLDELPLTALQKVDFMALSQMRPSDPIPYQNI